VPAASVVLCSAEDGQQQLVRLPAGLPDGLGFGGAAARKVEECTGKVDAGQVSVDGARPGGG
jgi:hypothetical protein